MKLNDKLKAAVIIAVVVSLIVAGVALAAYTMTSPSSNPLTVTDPTPTPSPTPEPIAATLSKIELSVPTITVGEEVTLSTTVSDSTPDITVTFFNNGDGVVGTAITDTSGIASLTITPPLGTWTYYATAQHD